MAYLNNVILSTVSTIIACCAMATPALATTRFSPACPKEITVSQQLTSTPSGWRAFHSDAPHFLSGITLYAGKPEEMASLKPDFSKDLTRATWDFSPSDKIFISCRYNQTNIELTQALPEHTQQCTLRYNKAVQGDNGFLPDHMECRR